MNAFDTSTLTDRQRAHVQAFDQRTKPRRVDFDYYENPRYGPWNPYWYVHRYVTSRCNGNGQKLLSDGCDNGRDALLYARAGYQVFGIDISGRAIEIATDAARQHGMTARVQFSQQAAEALTFPADYFDVVVGVNVLHHVSVPDCTAELRRVVKPDGYCIFKEPLLTPIRDKVRNSALVRRCVPPGIKNIREGLLYSDSVPGEKSLDPDDFATIRRSFESLSIQRWHVLSKLAIVLGNLERLERWDWRMFSLLPFLRSFGDQAVLIFEKKKRQTS